MVPWGRCTEQNGTPSVHTLTNRIIFINGFSNFTVSGGEMNLIAFECTKCRDGYRLITKPSPTKGNRARRAYYLLAASDRFDRYSVAGFPALFANFADAPGTPEGLRRFANNFSLPSSEPYRNELEERVASIMQEQAAMKRALAAHEKGDNQELIGLLHTGNRAAGMFPIVGSSGLARLELRLDAVGKVEPVIVPSNLMQAMWIQFLLHAASDARLFRCEQCGKPFVVGSGTRRRSTAKYCSNACKVAAFKARQEA